MAIPSIPWDNTLLSAANQRTPLNTTSPGPRLLGARAGRCALPESHGSVCCSVRHAGPRGFPGQGRGQDLSWRTGVGGGVRWGWAPNGSAAAQAGIAASRRPPATVLTLGGLRCSNLSFTLEVPDGEGVSLLLPFLPLFGATVLQALP